jgi:hypothetical protein
MAATARKSVHISRIESPQSRKTRARKNHSGDRAGSRESRRSADFQSGILKRRPSQTSAPTPSPPCPKSVAKSPFATRLAGLNLEHFSEYTRSLLRRAYPWSTLNAKLK